MTSSAWSSWRPIGDACAYRGPAVYQVRLQGPRGVRKISRFLRRDPRGLLCIGMTGNMWGRIRQFERGLSRGTGHSEANLLHQLEESSSLNRLISRVYQYRFRALRTRAQAAQLEEQLIKRYLKRFGEVPPLNSAIPNRYPREGG